MTSLPSPTSAVELYVMLCGKVSLPEYCLFENGKKPGDQDTFIEVPVYVFYIHHPSTGKRVLFDLGIRKVLNRNKD